MFSYCWPIALVIVSNIMYQICAKSVPGGVSPFVSLTVTYIVGALCSMFLFFVTGAKQDFMQEVGQLNWASYVLGIVIVGLEAGFICAYKAGWPVSTASVVQSSFLAVALIFVGFFLYQEALTWNKLVGVGICLLGLLVINWK